MRVSRAAGAAHLPVLVLAPRRSQADDDQLPPRLVEGQLAPLGELLGDPLDSKRGDAGEDAGGAAGDGEVGDVAEVAVEGRLDIRLVNAPGEGADHREGGEVDPDRLQPGRAQDLGHIA